MADFIDNFNFDPVSTEVKTTSYTIPSGQYARVVCSDFSTDFKIDGNIVVSKGDFSFSASISSGGVIYTNASGKILVGNMSPDTTLSSGVVDVINSSTTLVLTSIYGTAMFINSVNTTTPLVLMPGHRIYVSTIETFRSVIVDLIVKDLPSSSEHWVPEGTLIEGTNFTVELFNKQGS